MKSYNRLCAAVIAVFLVLFFGAELFLYRDPVSDAGRPYRVEANRIEQVIAQQGYDALDLSDYTCVTGVYPDNDAAYFYRGDRDYLVREIDGVRYRIDYVAPHDTENIRFRKTVTVVLIAALCMMVAVLIYIRRKILRPFELMKDVPYELSKGNLTTPLKESKSRFFGKFAWGVDLLRENMEAQKQQELNLQREKKTLILSISHDIKTPLSAIKLYAKALTHGLYPDKEKQTEIAVHIGEKADEIEAFVTQIIRASNEDFLRLEVHDSEFYLSAAVDKIRAYYTDKLSLIHTAFSVEKYADCMLRGDCDRLIEVIQNVIENAVKYGDGQAIALACDTEEDGCRLIRIKNSGCTLTEAELPHIFDSFWRGANTGTQSGSGLGLYICRQLMHKMGGEIFAEIADGWMCVTIVTAKS